MKLSLVLGGGGAKGSYQIGVIKALNEYNLLNDLKIVVGTSIGAFNACLVMEKLNYEQMLNIWSHIENDTIYKSEPRYKKDRLGIFDQTKMYNVLVSMQKASSINKSNINGYAVACKIKETNFLKQLSKDNTKEKVFHLNNLKDPHKAVLASSSIPVLFGPTKINNNYYVDGGLVNNLAVDVATRKKSNVIFVINLSPVKDLSIYYKNNIIIDFSPPEKLSRTFLGSLDFSYSTMEERINYGYEVACNVINNLIKEEVIFNGKININKIGVYKYY